MNKDTKSLILITAIIVSSILAIFTVASIMNQQQYQNIFPFPHQPQQANFATPAELQLYAVIRMIFSIINMVLLTVLVIAYVSIYLKTRSEFTIGLLIFATAFLVKDIAASPILHSNGIFGVGQFTLWLIIPDFLELAALSVLVYLSIKY